MASGGTTKPISKGAYETADKKSHSTANESQLREKPAGDENKNR